MNKLNQPLAKNIAPFRERIFSERSWWIAVPDDEVKDFGKKLAPGLLIGVAMTLGGALASLVAMKLKHLPLSHPFSAGTFAIFILGFAVMFMSNRIVARWARRIVAQRPSQLFTPDLRAAFVGIEPTETYNKFKLVADEIGFIQTNEHGLLFELQRWRATLHRDDVVAQIITINNKSFNVRLDCGTGPEAFSIVMPIILAPKECPVSVALSPRDKARWFLQWLGLQESTPPTN